ncbi:MAG: HD-GYP domain-containing protein (c-di-GMP phosphodiesterase class II) [Paraglaciecola sp.]|jgi:HD-GYP domain-containing protein (c-di-GMP phosphodiesterase class II)
MLQKVDIDELCPGMFVTNVTKQHAKIRITSGGRLTSKSDIVEMRKKGILQVEIDLAKSTHLANQDEGEAAVELANNVNAAGLTYKQQLDMTLTLYEQARNVHRSTIRRFVKGRVGNLQEVEEISREIVDKVFKCDEAIGIFTLIKDHSDYLLEHSINCSILMTIFGKHLGFDQEILYKLCFGVMLMDIGMVKMPLLLIEKPGSLSPNETEKIQTHVKVALTMLGKFETISELSLEVIEQHHERLDGSGYPKGLHAEQISQYGRMVAIVDIYDALTSKRPYREALNPAHALIKINEEELGLDKTLVNSFIECVGTNPIGSVVKLQSGKLAMVLRLNKQAPLKPLVMVFYDLQTKSESGPKQVDLAKTKDTILSSISPDDFGIEMVVFLKQVFKAT